MPAFAMAGTPAPRPAPAIAPAFPTGPAGPSSGAGQFPADRVGQTFRRFAAMVRRAVPSATVLDWTDADATAAPSGAAWVRLTPSPRPFVPLCVDPDAGGLVSRSELLIVVDTSTDGPDPARSMALDAAIRAAVLSDPVDAQLDALGVSMIVPLEPCWGFAGADAARCEGRGSFELTLYHVTPT